MHFRAYAATAIKSILFMAVLILFYIGIKGGELSEEEFLYAESVV